MDRSILIGFAAGGYAGNKVQGNMQAKDTYTTTERMDRRPGNRIPVENGQLVLGQLQ